MSFKYVLKSLAGGSLRYKVVLVSKMIVLWCQILAKLRRPEISDPPFIVNTHIQKYNNIYIHIYNIYTIYIFVYYLYIIYMFMYIYMYVYIYIYIYIYIYSENQDGMVSLSLSKWLQTTCDSSHAISGTSEKPFWNSSFYRVCRVKVKGALKPKYLLKF